METQKLAAIPKAPLYLLGLCALIAFLFVAQDILIPLVFSALFAIMLSSAVKRLVKRGFSRILAVTFIVIPAILLIISFSIIFFSQFSNFADSFPKLLEKFQLLTRDFILWGAEKFNVSPRGFQAWLNNSEKNLLEKSGEAIGATLSTMGNTVVGLFLVPVYIFMMLYYQPIIVGFIRNVFGQEHHEKVNEILPATKEIIKSYLVGLIIQTAVVAALNSVGLLILGIEYALLLGLLGGFLNVIPYLGAIITLILYMMVALVTKSSPSYALLVLINYGVIQFIDNNFLVPKIIGSKVKLNALVSIVAVISGGALWGIPGMFLSIPIIALVKVICDRIDFLQPWGDLLGDNMPPEKRKESYWHRFNKRKLVHGS